MSSKPHERALVPVLLLGFEALALSFAFDLHVLTQRGGSLAGFGTLGRYLPLCAVLSAGAALALGRKLLAELAATRASHVLRWTLFGCGAFGAALGSTTWLLRADAGPPPLLAALVWSSSIVAWIALRLHAALPLGRALELLRAEWRRVAFGLGVGLAAFSLGHFGADVWYRLAPITLLFTGLGLRALGERPWLGGGEVLGVRNFSVEIAPVCSGIEGMMLLGVFLVAFVFHFRAELRVVRALALVPVFVLAAYFANVLRLIGLVELGAHGHEELALSGFHSKAGWLLFSALAVLAVALLLRLDFTRRPGARPASPAHEARPSAPSRSPATVYLLPLVVLTAVALFTEAFRVEVDRFYAARGLVASVVLFVLRAQVVAAFRFAPNESRAATSRVWLSSLALGALVAALWIALRAPDAARHALLTDFLARTGEVERALFFIQKFAVGALVVPVVEELAFRGYVLRRFDRPNFEELDYARTSLAALAFSSLFFGALHGASWLEASLAGLLFGVAARSNRTLVSALVAHVTANVVIFTAALASGRFDLF